MSTGEGDPKPRRADFSSYREWHQAWQRWHRRQNLARYRERDRQYYRENAERKRAQARESHRRHAEKEREQARTRRQKPEKRQRQRRREREYYRNNLEKQRAYKRLQRERRKAAKGHEPSVMRIVTPVIAWQIVSGVDVFVEAGRSAVSSRGRMEHGKRASSMPHRVGVAVSGPSRSELEAAMEEYRRKGGEVKRLEDDKRGLPGVFLNRANTIKGD